MNEKLAEMRQHEGKMTVNDFLNDRERKIHSRYSVLQSGTFNFLKVAVLGYERQQNDESSRQRVQIL